MATNKMTKREVLNAIVNAVMKGETLDTIKDEVVAFAENEIAILNRKAEKAQGVQSKTQKENVAIKNAILDVLSDAEAPMTTTQVLTQLIARDVVDSGTNNQKISALLRQLGENGTKQVVKEKDKKASVFRIATNGDYADAVEE